MEIKRRQPIGVELVKRGVVTETDIAKALDYQREHPSKKLGDILYILNVTDEQRLIGQYFIQLDNLIIFHHRKLEKLKQIKQAMLHKMFV